MPMSAEFSATSVVTTWRLPGSHVAAEEYVVLPDIRRARFLVPVGAPAAVRAAFTTHLSTVSRRSRVYGRVISAGFRSGAGRLLPDVARTLLLRRDLTEAEWQRAERSLDQGEVDHAARLGSYYRRGDTDFGRLSAAIEGARSAVRLAGDDLDMRALSTQLGADGEPDPLLPFT